MRRCFCRNVKCLAVTSQNYRRHKDRGGLNSPRAGYRVFCSGVDESSGRAGQHGIGLAVKESIVREATWTQELTNERLMSMTFHLAGKSNAIKFLWHMTRQLLCPIRESRRMLFGGLKSAVS